MAGKSRSLKASSKSNRSSLIDAAHSVVRAANRMEEVTKVIHGIIKNGGTRTGNRHLVINEAKGGLEVKVVGNESTQMLYVVTSDPGRTRATLEAIRL